VGKGIAADDGFVGLDNHAGVVADHAAGTDDLGGVDACMEVVVVAAGVQAHDHFFQAGVAGPLADAVNGDFRLAGAGADAGQRVGGRQTQIVVAVNRPDHPVAARRAGDQAAHQPVVFLRRRVADGVGDVKRCRPGLDGDGQHLDQEVRIGASGVFRAELDIVAVGFGVGNHLPRSLDDLLARHVQFVLHVDVGRGQEGMDARFGRGLDGFPGLVDVVADGAGQPGDDGAIRRAYFLGDALDGQQVVRAGGREARLDDVHAQAGQLPGDFQLLGAGQAGAGRLLAVAQGRVKDENPVGVYACYGRFGYAGFIGFVGHLEVSFSCFMPFQKCRKWSCRRHGRIAHQQRDRGR